MRKYKIESFGLLSADPDGDLIMVRDHAIVQERYERQMRGLKAQLEAQKVINKDLSEEVKKLDAALRNCEQLNETRDC